jgi:hypothetical protein
MFVGQKFRDKEYPSSIVTISATYGDIVHYYLDGKLSFEFFVRDQKSFLEVFEPVP